MTHHTFPGHARRPSLICAALASHITMFGCMVSEDPGPLEQDSPLDEAEPEPEPELAIDGHDHQAPACDSERFDSCGYDGDRYYHHPLQSVDPLPDGRLPLFDVKRSPQGRAYAIAEGFGATNEAKGLERTAELVSGIVELDVRPMTAEERSAKPARPTAVSAHDRFDDSLREAITNGTLSTTDELDVSINLARIHTGTLTQRINRRIAAGEVETFADRARVRQEELAMVARDLEQYLRDFAAEVTDLGGRITYTSKYAPSLRAALTLPEILALENHPLVRRIGLVESSRPDSLDGVEKAEVYQTRPFWVQTHNDDGFVASFDGENGSVWDLHAAVLDDEGFRTTHVGFREGAGGASRITSMWDCRTGSCNSVGSYTGISDHGTAVLGAVLSDYRDGQNPAINGTSSRERRSAPAGEARAHLYWSDRSRADQKAVYDNIVDRFPSPHVLVSSNSVGSATDCDGEDTKALDADTVYENGFAYFKSANNHGGPYCNVGPPGEAIGVFTVGAFDDPNGTVCQEKSSPIHANSGWGGHPFDLSQGKGRSIIDVLGAWAGAAVPKFSSDTAIGTFTGTSHATPSVASAALTLVDQMKNYRNTNFIDDPGVLYAWMLNMADRRNQYGSLMSSHFDHRTGAGNLRMRFVGNPGMDAPWYFYHYDTCIDDGEVYSLDINGGLPLAGDIDSLRAVAWWYDRRIEDGVAVDDIDLSLKTTAGALLNSSYDAFDNKERVFYQDVGGMAVKLELSGYHVTSDVEGCGSNSMRVFVTVMVEDNDRDDGDGPSYDPATCVGTDRL